MGAVVAILGLLADAVSRIETFVTVFIIVYSLLIFAYVITSWIRLPYSLNKFQRFLYDVCEPYLRLLRRVLPPLGPLDLSPIIAIGGLVLLEWIVNGVILERLH
jgi:YggT family protein